MGNLKIAELFAQLYTAIFFYSCILQGECADQNDDPSLIISLLLNETAGDQNNNTAIYFPLKSEQINDTIATNCNETGSKDCSELGFHIDVLFVGDYSLFEYFMQLSRNDHNLAYYAVTNYLNALFEQVHLLMYRNSFFERQSLILNLSATFVVQQKGDCPLMSYPLENLSSDSDETQRYDLLSPSGDSATQGMAYVGGICSINSSISVVEDVGGMATAIIVLHELAHSLGAHHDGAQIRSECDEQMNYLMAPAISGSEDDIKFFNTFRLSKCTTQQVEKFLASKSSTCMKSYGRTLARYRRLSQKNRQLPGELIVKQQQCMIAFSNHYGVCIRKGTDRLSKCRRLWCRNRRFRRNAPCETKAYLPLLDGTHCDQGKWCMSGKCVAMNKFQGCSDSYSVTCKSFSKNRLVEFCKSKEFRRFCCASCSLLAIATR